MPLPILRETVHTRQRILSSAQDVLTRKKVSGTRMRQISENAGISMGTLHYHFPSKTRLLLAVLDEMQFFFEKRQVKLLSTAIGATEKVGLFLTQQKQLLRDQPEIEEIFLDFWSHGLVDADVRAKIQTMYKAWRRDILQAIDEGIQTGEFNPGQTELAPFLLVALLEGLALQYLLEPQQVHLDETFQAAYQLILLWLQMEDSPVSRPSGESRVDRLKSYPSDLGEDQWREISPLLKPAKTGGRPRTTDLRSVLNALLYKKACNCSWRMLPHDFPGWQIVYMYWKQWKEDGSLEKIGAVLKVDLLGE